ncbi:bi-domain-containing oxidoreductase [Muricauda ruestringensis]|uniref:Bi-domain-containing oxidoreductase n=1 Tax=Flagellimonas aurea TaxID=2915619 RepID=A0ABS3G0D5_9FLAO|nr:bi-domain-containing oxidoreductase [Allomuricauda aurea]MBC71020.1 dehydrogenase [Allomuricauda sp.]MBO0352837.1 bi-domain-containing oxidoreductase [Allomuricauda aurea]|tara:strand:+ start:15788 stop:17908 length:2121 start_codon:yes stop_codon:yes gene_type:complete
MKQIIQDIKNGETILEEVPVPKVKSGHVLIKTKKSLVSLGTERMLVEFGKANFIQKAKQQPDKVKMVLDKVKTDGLKPTIDSVRNKLNQPLPLGYCNVGEVIGVGKGVTEFQIGDRVASNGNHAEYVNIPKNLVVKIPDNVTDDEATFTVIGAIGLQGIRLLNPTFGETMVVVGLGLIGLVTAELLMANGCNVIGFDFDPDKVRIAAEKGIKAINPAEGTDQVKFVESYTKGIGADGVIITASNKSNEIISQAAKMCRKRGRVVLVGVIGLNISRADFYEKEISFQVSCSYGPGRYDEEYEQKGNDYPIGYVRWTEKRNFEAILNAISKGTVDVKPLITERVPLKDFQNIYGDMSGSKSIASILEYNQESEPSSTVTIKETSFEGKKGIIGIIGAGNFTSSTILPNLEKLNAHIKYIGSSGGLSSTIMAKRHSIAKSTSDYHEILGDNEVDLVLITTKHNMHAPMVLETLKSGKSVFVEKPLALTYSEIQEIIDVYRDQNVSLNVGFNRRFAPIAKRMKQLLGNNNSPMNIVATMNAGFIPSDVWVHDMEIGGGRIIGEACHYIDLCNYLSGSNVKAVCMNAMGMNPKENTDNASILLKYENGANATINYFSNGSKAYSKERVEVYSQGRTMIMDNWRKLKTYGFKNGKNMSSKQDKGHFNQFKELIHQQQNGGNPIISFDEIINTSKTSIAAIESLQRQQWITIE